ncbi:MAG: hypothetical protein QM537_04220 [Candidatus Symbiobacter sp.]|nr:hypothetical protein [Candidatus Symbiobacter sp.]
MISKSMRKKFLKKPFGYFFERLAPHYGSLVYILQSAISIVPYIKSNVYSPENITIVTLTSLFSIILFITMFKREKDTKSELNSVENKYSNFTNSYISKYISNYYGGKKVPTNFRITIFSYDRRQNVFVQIGRYSNNETYNKMGRRFIPTDSGVIADAWNYEYAFVEDLPDPNTDEEGYIKESSKKFGMDESVIRNLVVKSRSFIAERVMLVDYLERLGVIMLESTNAKILEEDKRLFESLVKDEGETLALLMRGDLN